MKQKNSTSRLQRIQKISRLLKIGVLLYFLTPLCLTPDFFKALSPGAAASTTISIFNHSYAYFSDVPGPLLVLGGIGSCLYLLGVISIYRLLNLYEKGIVFSAANSLALREIGRVLLGWGFLGLAANIVSSGAIVFRLLIIGGLVSPWVIAGGGIYILAWIMDEGRKIQEEQELTV